MTKINGARRDSASTRKTPTASNKSESTRSNTTATGTGLMVQKFRVRGIEMTHIYILRMHASVAITSKNSIIKR